MNIEELLEAVEDSGMCSEAKAEIGELILTRDERELFYEPELEVVIL